MKILLISPCKDTNIKTSNGLRIPQLSLHILEGLTPRQHQVKIIEEENDQIDLNEECDLVGISCMTANAPRAYHLASEFHKRGRKVVLGGVHPTLLPEEALKYADSIVKGEAEGAWENLLKDYSSGALKRVYHDPDPPLERHIPMDFQCTGRKRLFNVIPVMTTRGCPYKCEFCCVYNLYGKKIRHAPVSRIVRDIESTGSRTFIFLDDNIIGNSKYATELFNAIRPLGIKWVGQASLSDVRKRGLIELAAKSGCKALFFGLESVSEHQLRKIGKSIREIENVKTAIKTVKDLGILFHASLIFGFDDDEKSVFYETLSFLNKQRIGTASFNILTPYPGTKIYEKFKSEGRLLTNDWKYYDHSTVVYKPKNMTPYELQSGGMWVKSEFSRLSSILRRFPGNHAHPLLYLTINKGIRDHVRKDSARLSKIRSSIFDAKSIAVGMQDSL